MLCCSVEVHGTNKPWAAASELLANIHNPFLLTLLWQVIATAPREASHPVTADT